MFSFALLGAAALLLTLAAALTWRQARRQGRHQRMELDALRQDLRALTVASVGVGERVHELERRQQDLVARQASEPVEPAYEQAIRLLQEGRSLEEVARRCRVNRSEVHLLGLLHGLDKAG